tara:strand:+ start:334 stop:666 length:333 start_codon:yes stop_codon:yes gene_type:complete
MYKTLLVSIVLLFSCSNENNTSKESIISKYTFTGILKNIHEIEAEYELTKSKDVNAKNRLVIKYDSLFKVSDISKEDFEASLNYYSSRPDELEEMYTSIIDEILKDNISR